MSVVEGTERVASGARGAGARLEAAGCAHAFGSVEVLHGVDLEVEQGTIHGIVGPNGSGKTTLLEILGGSLPPDAGEVRLDGRALGFRHTRHALAAGIVLVHQRPEAFPDVSVEEYLGFVGGPRQRTRRRGTPATGVDALELVGARLALEATLDSLTAAERKLLELGRALLLEPRFLLLDEPTAFLERQAAKRVLSLVKRFRDEGVGIVLVSQRLEDVAALADRTTVLREGRVRARLERHDSDPETLFQLIAGTQLPEGPGAEMVRIRERQRLATDLHDSVAQMLFAIGAEARTGLESASTEALERALRSIREIANSARSELRDTLTRLNRVPTQQPLQTLLDSEVRVFQEMTGIEAIFVRSGEARPLGDLKEALLIDTLAEALQNIRKHAMSHDGLPSHVVASLNYGDGFVRLSIHNDGGRRPGRGTDGDRGRGGLRLLAERAEQLRGELEVQFRDEGGAIVRLRLPATGSAGPAEPALGG